jgi:hypothetical protein
LKILDKNSKNRVAHFSRNGINVNTNFQIRENMISLRIGAVKNECVILLKNFYWPILTKNQEKSKDIGYRYRGFYTKQVGSVFKNMRKRTDDQYKSIR